MADRGRSPDSSNSFLAWFRWIAGAAFPANPFLYRLFFRTDLGWLCYWDGTRWLTVHTYTFEYKQQPDSPFAASKAATTLLDVPFRGVYAPFISWIQIFTNVLTTNNGTDNWTITFRGYNAAFSAFTTIHSFSTGTTPDTAGTNTDHGTGTMSGTSTPSNNAYLDFSFTKNNNPGNLYTSFILEYRLIVT